MLDKLDKFEKYLIHIKKEQKPSYKIMPFYDSIVRHYKTLKKMGIEDIEHTRINKATAYFAKIKVQTSCTH